VLTAGDSVGADGYRMAGLPDGLGALGGRWSAELRRYVQADRYMTVFMNHEMRSYKGIARAHGQKGAFVSQWTIDLATLQVVKGEDLVRRVMTWDTAGRSYADTTGTTAFDRFCSADLPARTALYDRGTGRGFPGRILLNGEEAGTSGRAFAHIVSGGAKGTTYELPYLGNAAWENIVANPAAGQQTVVVALDDASPGQVYVYVGTKQASGNPVQRAGLHGGRLYGIKVVDGGPNYGGAAVRVENAGAINGRFVLVDLSAYALRAGEVLDTKSDEAGVTEFARPEDGHWVAGDARSFLFATTGASGQTARLYRLRFDGTSWPAGGTIELVVDSAALTGNDGQRARGFDNITASPGGVVMVQEDGGSSAYLSKTWRVRLRNPGAAVQVLTSSADFFSYGSPSFRTTVEENTGVIDVTNLVRPAPWFQAGRRYYLANLMDHTSSPDPELVQGGQLYLFSGVP
jgi:hypothetical protein